MTYELKPCPKPSGKLVGGGKPRPKTRKPMKRTKLRCGAGSKKRGGHMFPKNVDEARRDFIRAQACAVTGRASGEWIAWEPWMPKSWPRWWKCFVVVAHVKSRGSGGKDGGNIVPLDSRMHEWQGLIGWKALVKKLKLEAPAEIAAEYERRYLLEAA